MDIRQVYEFIKDFWKMIKVSYVIRDDDQYWSDLVQYADAIAEKYENDELVKRLLLAYLDYQEERSHER